MDDVFDALEQEYESIEAMLAALPDAAWGRESLCAGWTVTDVVLHLAQTEEAVVRGSEVAAGTSAAITRAGDAPPAWDAPRPHETTDDMVEQSVSAARGRSAAEVFQRWTTARRASLAAMQAADPSARFPWATNPLKPRTLATTRLSEHWIHANDIAQPVGVHYPDTDRLWHVARLAYRTIPYAYARAGRADPPAVRVELVAPGGGRWELGDADAPCRISGTASEFCRIAGRRLAPRDAGSIVAAGDRVDEVLDLVRTYA